MMDLAEFDFLESIHRERSEPPRKPLPRYSPDGYISIHLSIVHPSGKIERIENYSTHLQESYTRLLDFVRIYTKHHSLDVKITVNGNPTILTHTLRNDNFRGGETITFTFRGSL